MITTELNMHKLLINPRVDAFCPHCIPNKKSYGFTLIEVAVVLAIVGLLLGMILKPLGASYEQNQMRKATAQLNDIYNAVIGFAQINGRLPCPATIASAGQEPAVCSQSHGFIPNAALGVRGHYNKNGHLLDPWNNPVRYSVSLADSATYGNVGILDFVSVGEMQEVGLQNLQSDLVICAIQTISGCPGNKVIVNQVPAVIYSTGKDKSNKGQQDENVDNDNIFVKTEYSQKNGNEYDDIVIWVSENILFTRLIDSGVLP